MDLCPSGSLVFPENVSRQRKIGIYDIIGKGTLIETVSSLLWHKE
jgi:hypothetical protein